VFDEVRSSELASRARSGDVAAFDELVRGCDRGIVELASRLLADRADAEDVRQLAWLRVWQGLADFDQRSRFTTWAYRIVVNLCRDRDRERTRRERRVVVGLEGADAPALDPGPDESLARAELAERVRAALATLPPDERECLVLRHWHAVPAHEIAAIVGRPRTTVQSCLARALTRLQFRLRPLLREREERADEPEGRRANGSVNPKRESP
jgi:RNA polymerase sigma-70 factor (ECF subfamily)